MSISQQFSNVLRVASPLVKNWPCAIQARLYRAEESFGRRSDPYDSDTFDEDPYGEKKRHNTRPRNSSGDAKFDVFSKDRPRRPMNDQFQGSFGAKPGGQFQDRMGQAGEHLKKINWAGEELSKFEKDFYMEHEDITKMTKEEHNLILKELDATVQGAPPLPKPILKFSHCNFDAGTMSEVKEAGFEKPSPIQQMGWPIALSGRDMIGIASTGSGKTLSYLLPALVHIQAQPKLSRGEGPIALVLAPTRELANQIQVEVNKFGSNSGVRNCAVYGGSPRYAQSRDLRNGVEIVVATPGRLLDFLDQGVTNLKRITFLVMDEADRMLDMGFEPQIRKIVGQIRPDRQTLMFSATWPKEIQLLSRDFCREDPTRVTIGNTEIQANPNIIQEVEVMRETQKKDQFFDWIQDKKDKRILVFTETKRGADALCRELKYHQFQCSAIHGNKEQRDRDRVLDDFKTGRCKVMVATDVAQRGLDVKDIDYVVNYDLPKTIEDYIHRIGRTGRGGASGTAISFFSYDYYTPDKIRMAKGITHVMKDVNQVPPAKLVEIASQRR